MYLEPTRRSTYGAAESETRNRARPWGRTSSIADRHVWGNQFSEQGGTCKSVGFLEVIVKVIRAYLLDYQLYDKRVASREIEVRG